MREDCCVIWPCKRVCSLAFGSMRKSRVPLNSLLREMQFFGLTSGDTTLSTFMANVFDCILNLILSIILIRDVNTICVMIDSISIPSLAIGQESI